MTLILVCTIAETTSVTCSEHGNQHGAFDLHVAPMLLHVCNKGESCNMGNG